MYLEFMARETKRFGVKILAGCLMTDYVPLIDCRSPGWRGYLFQGRFGSCVLDERNLVAAVRYVERNPVRTGITGVAWEYPWLREKV